MTRKTSMCYLAVFEFIEEKIFKLRPAEIMTDYEDGMRLAIKKRWIGVAIRGCWFHFCRAISKKCRKLGMTSLLKENRVARIIRKKLMSIPLLPANQIENGSKWIQKFARKKGLSDRFSKLFKYFGSYWLNQVSQNVFAYTIMQNTAE